LLATLTVTTNHATNPTHHTTAIGNINDEPHTTHRQRERRLTASGATTDSARVTLTSAKHSRAAVTSIF
jgi:hypothetical protein